MHLLRVEEIARDEQTAVDLGQTPAPLVVISASDSDLHGLAAAKRSLGDSVAALRLAALVSLHHPASLDLYLGQCLVHAAVIVVRILGGRSYWPYGVDRLLQLRAENPDLKLILLSGEPSLDPQLQHLSDLPLESYQQLQAWFTAGGADHGALILRHLNGLAKGQVSPHPVATAPPPLPPFAVWDWDETSSLLAADGSPLVAIIFYRAQILAEDTAAVRALCAALAAEGLSPLPILVTSLKDSACQEFLAELFAAQPPEVIITLTGFAAGVGFGDSPSGFFAAFDCPILQAIQASSSRDTWSQTARGLAPRDLAMSIVLPETDGRIGGSVISFKEALERDPLTQAILVNHRPDPELIAALVTQVRGWVWLRRTPMAERRIAIMLANYPVREGRIGNGVGLAVPESLLGILSSLRDHGYRVGQIPESAQSLMNQITGGVTNSMSRERAGGVFYPLADYRSHLRYLPASLRVAVTERWGEVECDPYLSTTDCGVGFRLPVTRFDGVAVVIQPPRGYEVDPQSSYHDPALIPPHYYLAVYLWLRYGWRASALVQLGKHGTVEWLPGKSVALSPDCWPRAIVGGLPILYPFIVNDPGEGTQAKRRSSAVILDHLTPPLSRAGSYGVQRDLETLIDEFHAATSLDPRRANSLSREIFALAESSGLLRDCGIETSPSQREMTSRELTALDQLICDLKELQIRDGLHVFGQSPTGELLANLTVSLVRIPRGDGVAEKNSLLRSLAADLSLPADFDPLGDDFAEAWQGAKPTELLRQSPEPWRSNGDTIERLESLALELVTAMIAGRPWREAAQSTPLTTPVLDWVAAELLPRLRACGAAETAALIAGLNGRFVAPGPSGAPSRGRPEVLPTGRNFFSVDSRNLPTPSAWQLGWRSAQLLVEAFEQEHGEPLRSLALSAWGTAQMRTGGDDIAQALALMGVRPRWEGATGRVIGFEIMPVAVLGRGRVDVTLRVSGLFRDAFPEAIALIDRATMAVAELAESAAENPLRAACLSTESQLVETGGMTAGAARRLARYRVFGSQSGSYGAGLQSLIDTGEWQGRSDLAAAYSAWSSTAYAHDLDGGASTAGLQPEQFDRLLARVQAVVHNQDNREHDLLDSDDYYQFEGGLAAAVEAARGHLPALYHNDHSRPESPKIRRLESEIARVIRGRAANPKWLAGVMRHGYKGVMEMAATLDYVFAFCATTGAVRSEQFELLHRAWLGDEQVSEFMRTHNPAALADIERRFAEAIARGFWTPRTNRLAGSA